MKGGIDGLEVKGKKIGFVLTGSFCTFSKTIPKMKELIKRGAQIVPIMSYNAYSLDTKFGKAKDFIDEIENITGKEIIHTIPDSEPIGPKKLTDIMVIAPCSRKYHVKISMRYYRYTSYDGSKITLKKWFSFSNCTIY